MKFEFKAGKLYVFQKDTPNPGGDKRKRYGVFTDLPVFPEGLTLRAVSRRQALEEFYRNEPELAEKLALFSAAELDEVTRLEGLQRGRGMFSWGRTHDARDELILDTIRKNVVEKPHEASDAFRDAGYPLGDHHDVGFLRVCEFAAREGHLSLEVFQEWVKLAEKAGVLE